MKKLKIWILKKKAGKGMGKARPFVNEIRWGEDHVLPVYAVSPLSAIEKVLVSASFQG